jgi:hypothetical protein
MDTGVGWDGENVGLLRCRTTEDPPHCHRSPTHGNMISLLTHMHDRTDPRTRMPQDTSTPFLPHAASQIPAPQSAHLNEKPYKFQIPCSQLLEQCC